MATPYFLFVLTFIPGDLGDQDQLEKVIFPNGDADGNKNLTITPTPPHLDIGSPKGLSSHQI